MINLIGMLSTSVTLFGTYYIMVNLNHFTFPPNSIIGTSSSHMAVIDVAPIFFNRGRRFQFSQNLLVLGLGSASAHVLHRIQILLRN